jgi:CubicO group peptidase (beta-lactamase class C family)
MLALALFACATPGPPSGSTALSPFDDTMRTWTAAHHVPRSSIAVMRQDRLVFAAGYGGRGASDRLPVWSLSKAVTAVCIATLVQDGALRFDDSIGLLLAPTFEKLGQPTDPRLAQVTVAQLLTHRSGLPNVAGDNRFAPGMHELLRRRRASDVGPEMLMPSILRLHLASTPGAEYRYSNVGYLLLGQIIERMTGAPYQDICGHRVLARAGIRQPALDPTWGRLLQSAAGWSLSGPEYLGFVRLLSFRSHGLLTAETQRWARTLEGRWTDDKHTMAYTLGIRLAPVGGGRTNILHTGGWVWDQVSATGGAIHDKRGTWFVLTDEGVAWFASYDGVSGETDPDVVRELHDGLWQAYRRVWRWPAHDEFAAMGVGPLM